MVLHAERGHHQLLTWQADERLVSNRGVAIERAIALLND